MRYNGGMKKQCLLAVAVLGAAVAFGEQCARFGFEEAQGVCASDSERGVCAALVGGARWGQGPFGTALATGVRGAAAEVDAVPGVDGGGAATVFLRFRKEGRGIGKYPCLLTSDAWSGMGGTLFFSTGYDLSVRLRADGTEASWTAFANMPTGRWTSVAVTFKRPDVTVYADGVPVKKGKWNHPFLLGRTHIGAWGADSFDGLIDDFRVWNEALPPERIAAIAAEASWKNAGAAERFASTAGVPVMTFDGTAASLTLDSKGCISSLREKVTGRELVTEPTPFMQVQLENGRVLNPFRLERRGTDRFACVFPFGRGMVEYAVTPFPGGWTFTVADFDVPGARTLAFARVAPSCKKWIGGFANAWSDEQSAVAVRAAQLAGEPSYRGGALAVWVDAAQAKGQRALLAAGPRAGFRAQLQEMTKAAGVPRSDCGGAWSMGSEQSRRSYVFASIQDGDIDYWIDLARRSGFSIIHINDYSWSGLLGPYPINPKAFPGGIEEMKRAADRVHAAGLQMGIHSLTGCINPRADWIHPVCDTNLVADYVYTLAQPLASNATELVVEELPGPKHSTVFTYSSNGNVLRIGGELLQYTGIRREKPYAFTGLTRGAFKTTKLAGTIPAGTRVDYLHQRYIAFYPNPDSPLAEKLASRLAEVYNFCGLDDFYFDGSEGMGTRYGIDAMRHKIFAKFARNNGHSASVEASCGGANNWWFQTRMATVDHPVWGAKRFHDWHIKWAVDNGRNANFLEPQMGWWAPRVAVPMARGHFPDDMEYFAAKNAGHDAAMSVQGITARPLPVGIRRQLAILGWYEHARLARAFTDEVQAYLAAPETEARLRQGDDGIWRLTDVEAHVHRAGLAWTRDWTVDDGVARRPAALRVEALYAPGAESTGRTLAGADSFAKMQTASAGGVNVAFDPFGTDVAHGRTFKLSASNTSAPRNGAWARARLAFDFPGLDIGAKRTVFGAWVKGDGSGALLNLQLTSPGEYHGGTAEHYLRLDFTGWKLVKFLLRERDSAQFCRYVWPYGGYAAIYRSNVSVNHIASFSAYLNDIPAGKSASVEIGEVSAWEMAKTNVTDAAVTVNGERFAIPFALASGEYAELDGGAWTKYAESGTAVARVAASATPVLVPGANACTFDAGVTRSCASEPRAEVTFFALGKMRPALKPLTAQMRDALRVEALAPFEYAPQQGLAGPSVLPVRPGESASLVVEVQGPVAKPTLTFGKTVCTFDETLAADESLVCRDGRTWKVVVTASGKSRRTGSLSVPLPTLSGSSPFAFSGEVPADKLCVVEILKEYSSR